MRPWLFWGVCFCLIAIPVSDAAPATMPATRPAPDALLARPMPGMNIKGVTLSDVVDFIRDVTGLTIVLDPVALKQAAVTPKVSITFDADKLSVQQTLDKVCELISKGQSKFVAGVVGRVVLITTPKQLQAHQAQYAQDTAKADADPRLAAILPEARFDNVSLSETIEFVGDSSGNKVMVNWKAMTQAGVTRSTPISLRARDLELHQVLRLVLMQAQLGKRSKLDIESTPDGPINIVVLPSAT